MDIADALSINVEKIDVVRQACGQHLGKGLFFIRQATMGKRSRDYINLQFDMVANLYIEYLELTNLTRKQAENKLSTINQSIADLKYGSR